MLRTRVAVLSLGTMLVLTSCGGGSEFGRWADYVYDHDITDVKAEVAAGNVRLARECLGWQDATENQKALASAALSAYATKAGYRSLAQEARAWMDENCSVPE